jgi:protein-tyrosine phosphatase
VSHKVSVIFVCLGNICRSPTAHGVFRQLVIDEGLEHEILIDSAGTAAWHVGKHADQRSIRTAQGRGIDMMDLRARKVSLEDISDFDYVLAMDDSNYMDLQELSLHEDKNKIRMFLDFSKEYSETEVPDPYSGGQAGFNHVFDMVSSASSGLLADIKAKYL